MLAKPQVHILATGGTIAGVNSTDRSSGYSPGKLSIDALLSVVPQVRDIADISVEQVFSIGSQDITEAHWLTLLKKVDDFCREHPDAGLVILHGTDTIEETAWFLQLAGPRRNPIVLVGAMRPASAISADGPANLIGSVIAAADQSARKRGVFVYSDNELLSARNATKIGSLGSHGFGGCKRGIDAFLSGEKIEWLVPPSDRRLPKFDIARLDALPKVEIIYVHASMSLDIIECALANDTQAIVVAGVGAGNMPKLLISRLAQAVCMGIVVVRSSRIIGGYVSRNVEIDDDACGFIAAGDLGPAKSRILTQFALLNSRSPEAIQDMFYCC